jgi:hypothetical protein
MKYLKYILGLLIGLWGAISLINLYGGSSTFATTVFFYFSLIGFVYFLSRKRLLSVKVGLGLGAFFFSLFLSEIVVRFIIKRHVTYSELGAGRYVSHYTYARSLNFRFLVMEGRKDLRTLEFDPGEKRDNFGDNIQYPDEFCNELGTRGPLPLKGRRVVYVMGDSFAEGAGAPLDSTYPFMLQNYLRKKDPQYTVLNLGVTGFDLFQEWNIFLKNYSRFSPKEAFFIVNTTNIGEIITRGGNERFLPDGNLKYSDGPWWEPIYAVSFVFRLLIHTLYTLDWFLLTPEQYVEKEAEALEKMRRLVEGDMSIWAKQHGVTIRLILQPMFHELYEQEGMYTKLKTAFSNMGGVNVCDSRPYLAELAHRERLYWEIDRHFRPTGYTHLAEFTVESCLNLTQ